MDASIDVLSTSYVPLENQCNQIRPSVLQIHARIRVLPKLPDAAPFDSATFTLYGAVRSEIGSRAALRKILDITEDRSWLEFESCAKESPESYVDVIFDILPKEATEDKTSQQSFIPTCSVTGQAILTTADVLSSQQIVKGKCDVLYWIEAEFRRGRRTLYQMKVNVPISQSSAPIQMQVTAIQNDNTLATPVKPLRRAMFKRGWPLKQRKYLTPAISVQLPRDLGLVYAATTKSYTNYQIIAVPLTFILETAAADDPCLTDLMGNFLGTASVEAKWHTMKTFSTTNLSGQNPDKNTVQAARITKKTVVKQKQLLSFPPFYQEKAYQTLGGQENSKYSATAMFEILLPDTISCPSVNTELLNVSYELELDISMESDTEKGVGIMPCAAKLKVPISIDTM